MVAGAPERLVIQGRPEANWISGSQLGPRWSYLLSAVQIHTASFPYLLCPSWLVYYVQYTVLVLKLCSPIFDFISDLSKLIISKDVLIKTACFSSVNYISFCIFALYSISWSRSFIT